MSDMSDDDTVYTGLVRKMEYSCLDAGVSEYYDTLKPIVRHIRVYLFQAGKFREAEMFRAEQHMTTRAYDVAELGPILNQSLANFWMLIRRLKVYSNQLRAKIDNLRRLVPVFGLDLGDDMELGPHYRNLVESVVELFENIDNILQLKSVMEKEQAKMFDRVRKGIIVEMLSAEEKDVLLEVFSAVNGINPELYSCLTSRATRIRDVVREMVHDLFYSDCFPESPDILAPDGKEGWVEYIQHRNLPWPMQEPIPEVQWQEDTEQTQ